MRLEFLKLFVLLSFSTHGNAEPFKITTNEIELLKETVQFLTPYT
jgi:hypothetical protein